MGTAYLGSAPTAGSNQLARMSDLSNPAALREKYFRRSGAKFETIERTRATTYGQSASSGVLNMTAIALAAGTVVSSITFMSGGTGASSPSHWWFGLYDSSLVQLATTADQLTASWASFTEKTLNISKIASGSASSYTVPSDGLYYLGVSISASILPDLMSAAILGNTLALAPALHGVTGSASTPPAFPFTASSISSSPDQYFAYAYVS